MVLIKGDFLVLFKAIHLPPQAPKQNKTKRKIRGIKRERRKCEVEGRRSEPLRS